MLSPRMGIEPTTSRFYSPTLYPCVTTGLERKVCIKVDILRYIIVLYVSNKIIKRVVFGTQSIWVEILPYGVFPYFSDSIFNSQQFKHIAIVLGPRQPRLTNNMFNLKNHHTTCISLLHRFVGLSYIIFQASLVILVHMKNYLLKNVKIEFFTDRDQNDDYDK